MDLQVGVIIVAGGSGRRMGSGLPKQFRLLGGVPVLARTINRFAEAFAGAEIVVVLPEEHIAFWHNLAARFEVQPHRVAAGGTERFHSVRNGLAALTGSPRLIAVHDGVRPLVSVPLIRRTAAAAAEFGAAIPVTEPVDSLREVAAPAADEAARRIERESHAIDRSRLRLVQTPQIFRAEWLTEAYEAAWKEAFTDDASVVEAAGRSIVLCRGEASNLKLTRPEDFVVAEALLAAQEEADTWDGLHEADNAPQDAVNPPSDSR